MKRPTTLARLAIGFVCICGIAAVALVAQEAEAPANQMTVAAEQFLASLPDDLRKKAEFEFDDPHRTSWFFTPQQDRDRKPTRKGVRLEELNDEQKKKALALLRSGTSPKGYEQATTIMSLEEILPRRGEKREHGPQPGLVLCQRLRQAVQDREVGLAN